MRAAAAVLLLALASWAMPAQAGCTYTGTYNATCATATEAAAAFTNGQFPSDLADPTCAPNARPSFSGGPFADAGIYRWHWTCAGGIVDSGDPSWAQATYTTNNCIDQPPLGDLVITGEEHVVTCSGGCEYYNTESTYTQYQLGGVWYTSVEGWEADGEVCSTTGANTPATPPERPDGDGDGVPDDSDAFPSDPTESADSDGDGIGDNADTAPNDSDNGEDGSSEETPTDGPGDETDNRAEGGGSCLAPPTCSGDGIQCNALFQAWKTRCALERAQAADGTLKISGTGTGGAVAVAGGGSGDDSNAGMFDDLKNGPDGVSETDAGSVWGPESTFTPDEAGWGFSRSCPAPPTITLAGMTRTLDTVALCDLAEIIGALVLLMAAAHAFFALAKG